MANPAQAIFPSHAVQVASAFVHIFGTSILAHCISRRILQTDSIRKWTWARACVLCIFLDSWLFLFSSGILVFGVGLETNLRVCTSAIFLCIAFYGTSKVLIYFFLVERIHVVWQPPAGVRRLKSPVYIVCLVTVLPYIVVVMLMIYGRVHHIRDDGVCVIGLRAFSSIFLLTYDLYINVFLTGLFLWPIFRSNFANPRVRRMALKTVIAAGISLTTSSINVAILTILHGKELGWLCLGSCGIDVITNALAIFVVTSHQSATSDACASLCIPDIHTLPLASPIIPSSSKSVNESLALQPAQTESDSLAWYSFVASPFRRQPPSRCDVDVIEITVTHTHSVVEDLSVRSGRSITISASTVV